MQRRSKRTLRLALVTTALVAVAAPTAYAKGGTGGGGGGTTTTTVYGTIKNPVSALASCTDGSTVTVTVQKGRDKVVERVLVSTGTPAGWADRELREDSTGRGLVVNGGTVSDLTGVTAIETTSTGSRLLPGVWNLTFTGTYRDARGGNVLETCVAHLTVVAE